MSAKGMFEKLGYEQRENDNEQIYYYLKKEHEQLQTDYATLKINYDDVLIDKVNKLKEDK